MIQLHDKNTARDEALLVLSSVREAGSKCIKLSLSTLSRLGIKTLLCIYTNSGHRFPANSSLCLSRLADVPCKKKSMSNVSGKFHFLESCQCVSLCMIRDWSFLWSSRLWLLFDHGHLFHNTQFLYLLLCPVLVTSINLGILVPWLKMHQRDSKTDSEEVGRALRLENFREVTVRGNAGSRGGKEPPPPWLTEYSSA